MDGLENVVDATSTEGVVDSQEVTQEAVQTQSESANEEVTTSQTEKPVQSQEENAKYAQVRREAESKAEAKTRDKVISEMYGESHGIHTYSDYQKAIEQEAEQKRRASLQDQGIDPAIVDEYVSNNPTVKKAAELIKQQEQQQKQAKEYGDFLESFRTENGRDFNSATDTIAPEVWEMTAKGKSLADAYAYQSNKQLKAKLAEYEAKFKAQETNTSNASSSPGSVTGNGDTKGDFISNESFEANKGDSSWVNKNFDRIMSSRAKW